MTQPSGWWNFTAQPGQVIHDSFTVSNLGDAPGQYVVTAVEGVTSPVSGIVYMDKPTGAAAWVKVAATDIPLAPSKSREVTFTVAVPMNATPGDHVAAISAANPEPVKSTGQFSLAMTSRTVVAVVIHIPGPVDRTSVSVAAPSVTVENQKRQILGLPLGWNADIIGKPALAFTVTDAKGKQALTFDRHLDSFTPHASIAFPVPLDNVRLPVGHYVIDGTFAAQHFHLGFVVTAAQASVPAPGQRGPHTAPSSSAGLYLAGAATVFLLDLILLTVLRRRRRNRA